MSLETDTQKHFAGMPVPVVIVPCRNGTPVAAPIHRFTLAQYLLMIETGVLGKEDRVELLEGLITKKDHPGPFAAATVLKLNWLLSGLISQRALLGIHTPINFSDSRPEPDVVLLKPHDDFYAMATPGPHAVLTLIEVADKSLDKVRLIKALVYAQAGITDYWIVNLIDRVLEVHRQPQPDGTYSEVRTLQPHESLAPLAFADVTISVADLLP